jgi:hypothetical protein
VTTPGKSKRKIAVIGTVNRDTIFRADGKRIEAYGGILFNIRVLAQLFGEGATIYPVANVGHDRFAEIASELEIFPNVDSKAIRVVSRPNNHCILRYSNISEKREVLKGWVGTVRKEQLRGVLGCNLILINFISGGDITRNNLGWLRRKFRGPLYIDLHSRTLGRHPDGTRFLRTPPRWTDYLAAADYLQLNEKEFQLLYRTEPSYDSCRSFFLKHLPKSRALLVTTGREGCLVTRRKGSEIEFDEIRPAQRSRAVDTTGCGDVFTGGFLFGLLGGLSMVDSAELAVQVASYASTKAHISDLNFRQFRSG